MSIKQRLDIAVFERGLAPSREKARAMIMAGEITVNETCITKAGTRVALDAEIIARAKLRFVSRGGDKLAAALAAFEIDVSGTVCADVGASTGGFTDCLLQHGASRVFAIDVGYGQLDYMLRRDSRVVVLERTNARYLDSLPASIDLVVIDAAFISLRLLLPTVKKWLAQSADIVALIKPQFEAGKAEVGKGGIVKDKIVHARVINEILSFAATQGFDTWGLIQSPIKGRAGNVEFLAWLRHGQAPLVTHDFKDLIDAVISL